MSTHWDSDHGSDFVRAIFYTPTEPFARRCVTLTNEAGCAAADQAARDDGYLPFDDLPWPAKEHWARHHAELLADHIGDMLA